MKTWFDVYSRRTDRCSTTPGLNEEPTRSAVPGPLPSVDSPGQAGPAFQDVDENPTNAEHRNPGAWSLNLPT
jgi:hypothetical protein